MAGTGASITRTHPLYDVWQPTWQLLQDVYRGDGGFLDGSNLIPHPREVVYKTDDKGLPTTEVAGYRDKFLRRKQIARYENFARTIVDTFTAHLFAKTITRTAGKGDLMSDLEQWWEDVDGAGTHIGDWMAYQQQLAWVYGHVVTLMDMAGASVEQPRTKAEQGTPVLRVYTPLDVLDWVYADGAFQALKVVEARPRDGVFDNPSAQTNLGLETRGHSDGAPKDLTYVVWTPESWTRYDQHGVVMDSDEHGWGCVPAVLHRARPIPGMPAIGASLLGDPRLHRDHFNMLSELRELLRSQTFSMLNIQLGEGEDIGAARGLLGGAASVETILWSHGAAQFIAPPDGPAAVYQKELEALERKLYRMAGLPWEGDSASAESADSRRLKAMDLNRLLAMYADEAERVEYQIARLFYLAGGSDEATVEEAMEADEVLIRYPDEFATLDIAQAAADVRDIQTLNMGATANRLAKERAIEVLLPDLSRADRDAIVAELKKNAEMAADPAQAAAAFRSRAVAGLRQAGGQQDGTQMQDGSDAAGDDSPDDVTA